MGNSMSSSFLLPVARAEDAEVPVRATGPELMPRWRRLHFH